MLVEAGNSQQLQWGVVRTNLSAVVSQITAPISTYLWTQVSGPSIVEFSSPSNLNTLVNFLVKGTYVFRMTITDTNNESSFDEVTVSISSTLPSFGIEPIITNWNTPITATPPLVNDELKIRLKANSLTTNDTFSNPIYISTSELSFILDTSVKVSTFYNFIIEFLDSEGLVTREVEQVILVFPPEVDSDVDIPVIIETPYTINSTTIKSTSSTNFVGCQMKFYLDGEELGSSDIDSTGLATLVLSSPLNSIGELTSRFICGSTSSKYSVAVPVIGKSSDLEVSNPVMSCEVEDCCNNEIIPGLTLTFKIRNLGPDIVTSGTEILLKTTSIPTGSVFSSDKGEVESVSNNILLTLDEDLTINEEIVFTVFKAGYDCSVPINCITLEAKLPSSYNDSCNNNKSRCTDYSPELSTPPVVNAINEGDTKILGYTCSGAILTKVKILTTDSTTPSILENFTYEVASNGAFTITLPSNLIVEGGDLISVKTKCPGKAESLYSNEILVGSPSSLTSKCLSGIKVRGVEGQTYEILVFNFTQQKILGRGTFTGPQVGISLSFNEPNLRNDDLKSGDCIGIRIISSCCAPVDSNKLTYTPIDNLQLNYVCGNNGVASIQPSWVSGAYPITLVVKNRDSGDVLFSKNIKSALQSTLITGIPNGNLRLEVGDCGGCTNYVDFESSCNVFTATRTITRNGTFYRQTCPQGCTPRAFIYESTKSSTKTSVSSQEEANQLAEVDATALAQNDVNSNGQSKANTFGYCDNCSSPPPPPNTPPNGGGNFSSTRSSTRSGDFTRQTCPVGYTGGTVTYSQSATETRTSTNSQQEADSAAQAAADAAAQALVNAGGQAYANINGPCTLGETPPPSCTRPTSINISGNTSPTAGSTESYSASISGGSGYSVVWSVQGGSINGSNSGSTVSITWGSDTSSQSSVGVLSGCPNSPDLTSDFEFFILTSSGGGTPPGGGGTPPVSEAYNLLLCSDGSNANYQVADSNLSTGIIIKDNGSGICYTVANWGSIVGPLISSYQEYSSCSECQGGGTPPGGGGTPPVDPPLVCTTTTFENISGTDGSVTYIDCNNVEHTVPIANGSSDTFCLKDMNYYSTSVSMQVTHSGTCS